MNSVTQFAGIKDGASNTIIAGERPVDAKCWAGWLLDGTGMDGTGARRLGPRRLRRVLRGHESQLDNMFHYWSYHPGGANFLMVDGSVHFIKYTTNDRTFRALCTRKGGEFVSAGDY